MGLRAGEYLAAEGLALVTGLLHKLPAVPLPKPFQTQEVSLPFLLRLSLKCFEFHKTRSQFASSKGLISIGVFGCKDSQVLMGGQGRR